jgi:hypothetical protein
MLCSRGKVFVRFGDGIQKGEDLPEVELDDAASSGMPTLPLRVALSSFSASVTAAAPWFPRTSPLTP